MEILSFFVSAFSITVVFVKPLKPVDLSALTSEFIVAHECKIISAILLYGFI